MDNPATVQSIYLLIGSQGKVSLHLCANNSVGDLITRQDTRDIPLQLPPYEEGHAAGGKCLHKVGRWGS